MSNVNYYRMLDKLNAGVTETKIIGHDPHCRNCRRFEAAKAAMEGIVGAKHIWLKATEEKVRRIAQNDEWTYNVAEIIAEYSTNLADALLAKLEKGNE